MAQTGTGSKAGGDGAAFALLLLLAAGFGFSVLVLYPGYITVDARYVYAEAKAWHFGDWQSPAMGVLWRMIDPIAPGSLSMFLLTVALYWLGFGTLAFVALRSSAWLAFATPLLAFSPPAFFLRRDDLARRSVRGDLARGRRARVRRGRARHAAALSPCRPSRSA